jgi:hypothetical protein
MRHPTRLLLAAAITLAPFPARADLPQLVSPDASRFRVGGSVEMQLRGLADGFEADRAYLSQWAWVLNIEPELDIAPDGWGPFDQISAFARIEARYECIWTGCWMLPTWRHFGDRATRAPARNWADGSTEQYVGGIDLTELGILRQPVHGDGTKLLDITHTARFDRFYDVGISRETVANAFGPLADDLFTFKSIGGPRESLAVPLGPWRPDSTIRPNGSRGSEASTVLPLPLRPHSESLYIPSERLRSEIDSFDSFDQNFRQRELEWNHGASQDEWELRELYVDLEMFESKLWIRAGKQNIVWGKTELFRTTDQFNPVDIGLASLPTFEESRIPLWSVRGVWSFYEVGPFEDVRLELAMNFDDFEPIDTGRCGEPYTVWAICLKSTGLWAHGVTGSGIAGEQKPPHPWDSSHGIEFGGRLEWRWKAFSFALMDFYGFDDIPAIELFNTFERRVEVRTGEPLDSLGRPLVPETALEYASGNRQTFDFGCLASQGFGDQALLALTGGAGTIPDVSDRCLGDIVNLRDPITLKADLFGVVVSLDAEPTNAIGALLAGQLGGNLLLTGAIEGLEAALTGALTGTLEQRLVRLNRDPNDGPPGGGLFGADCPTADPLLGALCGFVQTSNVSYYLTDQQEALLGCGPFYLTDCDVDGIDIFNSEASVLLQAFPGFEYNPVGTRFEGNKVFILPGARGPLDPGYDPGVDGTPPEGYRSEMAALSSNFATGIAVLGIGEGDTACRLDLLETCAAIRALIALTGSQRPELRAGGNGRYGRRDFAWHGGGEALIRYPKRNVLGFSFDFAEDHTKTSWGTEFTWINADTYASNSSSTLLQETDTYNLTVSVDRPTFVNFLNANRTFFLNAQVFLRYIPHYDRSFDTNGPLSVLATMAIATGYFQDRLLPALVYVHDFDSASGGVIGQVTYRFNEAFSVTVGALGFYGGPENNRIARYPIQLFDTQTSFDMRTRYAGLSVISERDEVFLKLRYTF